MNSDKTLHARTKAFATENRWQSWWCVLSTASMFIAALAGTLPPLPLAARIFFSVLAGLLLVRLFVIYHDHQHRAILCRSGIAEFFMRLFGISILCPSTVWRSSHDYHHAHNCKLRSANIGSYPIMTRDNFKTAPWGDRFQYLFVRHPLNILFGYFTVFLGSMVVIPIIKAPLKHYDSLLALILHAVLVTMLVTVFGWSLLLVTVILPFFIAGAIGSYLFYAQHNFPDVTFKDKAGWTFEGAALESSSHMRMSPVMNWFTANIGYHHIHHLNHRIPFYRLPEVHREMPELRAVKTTSLHPRDIIRCLRLKVWCVQTQRMVNLKGV